MTQPVEKPDLAGFCDAVEGLLNEFRGSVEALQNLDWKPSDGYLPVLNRVILCRQFGVLQAALCLVRSDHGHAAGPLLRSACEELIWADYLHSLDVSVAEQLCECIMLRDVGESLKALNGQVGGRVMRELDLAHHFRKHDAMASQLTSNLRRLGTQLAWPKRVQERGLLPSVAFLARATGHADLYNFLYHETSRFVHFSVAEAMRWGWGTGAQVRIDSTHVNLLRGFFALHWGVRLFLETFGVIAARLGGELPLDASRVEAAVDAFGKFGQMPSITATELAAPSSSIAPPCSSRRRRRRA